MRFTAKNKSLLAALNKTRQTVAACNDTQPILTHFLMRCTGKKVSIASTDLDLSVVCDLVLEQEGEPGDATIPGQSLISIYNNSPEDEVTIEADNTLAKITAGKFVGELKTLPCVDFPPIEKFPETQVDGVTLLSTKREPLAKYLKRVDFSITTNEARRNLMAVYINDGFLQASDGHCSAVCKFDPKILDVLIPSLAVNSLVNILKTSAIEEVEITMLPSYLMFRLSQDVYVARRSHSKFPNIPKSIIGPTANNELKLTLDKDRLVAAIRRVAVTSKSDSASVKFAIRNGELIVSSESEGGKSSEPIQCTWQKGPDPAEPFECYFNHTYITNICGALETSQIVMKMAHEPRVPVRVDEGEFTACLMRLTN
jgi:DNA polymerase III sliding clamp (beta) subunit (PCNA family)